MVPLVPGSFTMVHKENSHSIASISHGLTCDTRLKPHLVKLLSLFCF